MNLLLTRTKHEDLKLNSVNRNGHGHILMVGFSCSPLEVVVVQVYDYGETGKNAADKT